MATPSARGLFARAIARLSGREAFLRAGERRRTLWLDFADGGWVPTTWSAYSEERRLSLIIDESDPDGRNASHGRCSCPESECRRQPMTFTSFQKAT